MSCLKGIKSIGGYVSTPVDKVEYTGIEWKDKGTIITTVVVNQKDRTIQVELNNLTLSLLKTQPLSTVNDDYILLCTVDNGSRSYEWISYSELLDRITADEESIKELREKLIEEINRAKEAEKEINDNLTKEISRATKAEEDLKKQIDDETSNRITADNNLNISLNNEVERAKEAEKYLNDRIDNLDYSSDTLTPAETISQITQTDGKILVTKQSIQIGMDQVTNLTDEFSKVRNEFGEADNQLNTSLSQKITDEQSRAESKEAELSNSITQEIARAKEVENELNSSINTEKERATAAESSLDTKISNEITNRESGDNFLKSQINEINAKIPEQASSTNQLADKDFVNSSISTSTATFRGTYNSVDDLPTEGIDNNDYAFVRTEIQTGLDKYDKYTYNGTEWVFEYSLNNSSFTEAQWKAINSNITEALTLQITTNKNNINDLNTSLNGEINRAKEAESNLSISINNERERAENAENTLTSSLNAHIANKENPHEVTKAQIGLENVDNTSDKDKPISTATQTSLDNLKLYVDNLIKSMGELKGTLEEGTLIIGPGEQK